MQIRILVAQMPQMLTDIVTTLISRQDDMVLVGRGCSEADLPETVKTSAAEVVIVGCDEPTLSRLGERLLSDIPRVRVLALEGDGRSVQIYELRPHRTRVQNLSPEALLAAIRVNQPAAELETAFLTDREFDETGRSPNER